MITIHATAEVPYPIDTVYEFVNDIPAYTQFVPFCTVATMTALGENEVKGRLTFAWLGIVESFTTHNVLTPPYTIDMTLVKGPFKYLKGGWTFKELEKNHTTVEFLLRFEFEFSNPWVDYVLQPIFNTLSSNAIKVFIQRANDCYGKQATLKRDTSYYG